MAADVGNSAGGANEQDNAPNRDHIFQAYLKEAEFLRDEALQCIDGIRRLTIYSTSIAGAALPILAGLMAPDDDDPVILSLKDFIAVTEENHLVIQFVCLGVSLTSLAFLRIYLGTFQQIFNFAAYFRDYLVPAVNRHVGSAEGQRVLHWEDWLKGNRSKNALHVGDSDLAAEPFLMAIYCLAYGSLFLLVGYNSQTFPKTSVIVWLFLVAMVVLTIAKFFRILRNATK